MVVCLTLVLALSLSLSLSLFQGLPGDQGDRGRPGMMGEMVSTNSLLQNKGVVQTHVDMCALCVSVCVSLC